MKKHSQHTFHYVLAYYSEQGWEQWNTCNPVTTHYETAKKKYDEIKAKGYPVKLRSKTVTWETLEEANGERP